MPRIRSIAIALTLAALAASVLAAPTAAPVRAEIDTLLARLVTSGCAFGRNDAWHAGADAKAHLLNKLEYIEKYATIATTEQFIDLAATKSSMSGNPYLVRCGNAAAVQSGPWLLGQLQELRGKSGQSPR
jgi:hypothetical protein